MTELRFHLSDLDLVNAVFRNVVDDLVHLNEKLCANGQLIDDFRLHAHVMALVLAKECAC